MSNKKYPHWKKVRLAQIKVANSNPKYFWVDTDDLNDGLNRRGKQITNDLHYSAEGYKTLGKRFAQACLIAIGELSDEVFIRFSSPSDTLHGQGSFACNLFRPHGLPAVGRKPDLGMG